MFNRSYIYPLVLFLTPRMFMAEVEWCALGECFRTTLSATDAATTATTTTTTTRVIDPAFQPYLDLTEQDGHCRVFSWTYDTRFMHLYGGDQSWANVFFDMLSNRWCVVLSYHHHRLIQWSWGKLHNTEEYGMCALHDGKHELHPSIEFTVQSLLFHLMACMSCKNIRQVFHLYMYDSGADEPVLYRLVQPVSQIIVNMPSQIDLFPCASDVYSYPSLTMFDQDTEEDGDDQVYSVNARYSGGSVHVGTCRLSVLHSIIRPLLRFNCTHKATLPVYLSHLHLCDI